MAPTRDKRRESRLSFVDRIELRLSTHRHVDGLWVGTFEPERDAVLRRVEDALALIKTYDRRRYDRLTRDLARVWVRILPGDLGQFSRSLEACELDVRFVLDATSTPAMIAATIVHEATHARLFRRGIGYEPKLRARAEAVCFRRELAFANKLPDGGEVRERAQSHLELAASDDFWTDTSFGKRYAEGSFEAARFAGVPAWLARIGLAFGRLQIAIRQRLRRVRQQQFPATVIASEAKQSRPHDMSK
jgi:hypothetical protein